MSRWNVEVETQRHFCPQTGKPDPWISVWLRHGDERVGALAAPAENFRLGYSEEDRADATAKRGRWIASILNAASPYIEVTDDTLDPDALDEALKALGSGPQSFGSFRDVLNFLELKYAAVMERNRELAQYDAEADYGDSLRKAGAGP